MWVAVAVWTCRQGIGCGHKQCLWHLLHVVLGSCFGRLNHEGENLPHSTQLAGFYVGGGGVNATPSWRGRCMYTLERAWTVAVTSMLACLCGALSHSLVS